MVRKTKWGMIALGALMWACATDGAGNPPGGAVGNENPFSNGTERPGGGATETPVNTATEKPCSVSGRDVLSIFDLLCEKAEECGFGKPTNPDPPVDEGNQQRVVPGGYSAADGLDVMLSYLPLRRTLGESQGGSEFDLFGKVCKDVSECLDSGSCGDIDQSVTVESPVCVGDVLACVRAIFDLIPCDGDVSGLENARLPAACESLGVSQPVDGTGGSGPN